jgi:hypothetical protein
LNAGLEIKQNQWKWMEINQALSKPKVAMIAGKEQ